MKSNYRHTSYQLQYREWVNGKWRKRTQYVPKNKARALRARIKRAKQKDKKTQEAIKEFLNQVPDLEKCLHNPDIETLDDARKRIDKILKIKPLTFQQLCQITAGIINIFDALTS